MSISVQLRELLLVWSSYLALRASRFSTTKNFNERCARGFKSQNQPDSFIPWLVACNWYGLAVSYFRSVLLVFFLFWTLLQILWASALGPTPSQHLDTGAQCPGVETCEAESDKTSIKPWGDTRVNSWKFGLSTAMAPADHLSKPMANHEPAEFPVATLHGDFFRKLLSDIQCICHSDMKLAWFQPQWAWCAEWIKLLPISTGNHKAFPLQANLERK